ncbi:hypothetical protein TrLO_g15100, partial [Triparma laevis f. longispina]
ADMTADQDSADDDIDGAEASPSTSRPLVDLPYSYARDHGVLLLSRDGDRLQVALREGSDPHDLLEVRRYLDLAFDVELVDGQAFEKLLSAHYAMDGSAAAMAGSFGVEDGALDDIAGDIPSAEDLLDSADDAPTIRLINGIIAEAARQGASDIHIEPYETGLVVRMRVDGVLTEKLRMPPHVASVIVNRIKLNDGSRNILTVEDPVEYAIEGIGQTQVNAKVGLTFAAGLRAILRQDPDVVMIGEIRDRETADIAVQASLTGHLVLSTVHTNDAVGAITRMRDMKVEPFLLASTLRAVIAQRLVRKLCQHCRTPIQADGSLASLLGFDNGTLVYRETGCEQCNQTGFAGRIGVFEAIRIDDTLRKLINDGGDEARIAAHAFLKQPNLGSAARALVREGLTTAEEAIRISRRDHQLL